MHELHKSRRILYQDKYIAVWMAGKWGSTSTIWRSPKRNRPSTVNPREERGKLIKQAETLPNQGKISNSSSYLLLWASITVHAAASPKGRLHRTRPPVLGTIWHLGYFNSSTMSFSKESGNDVGWELDTTTPSEPRTKNLAKFHLMLLPSRDPKNPPLGAVSLRNVYTGAASFPFTSTFPNT